MEKESDRGEFGQHIPGHKKVEVKMDKIKLTFVVPVYNVEKYLERCVKSIICRTGVQYEIILVDDGSTDSSGSVCDALCEQYVGIVRVIHKENNGLASARNRGLEEAKGEYIVFVDSDDWLESGFIDRISPIINVFRPDIIKYGYQRIEKQEEYTVKPYLEDRYYEGMEVNHIFLSALANGRLFDTEQVFIMSACMAVYKKEVIDACKLFFHSEREILNEDILFNLELLLRIRSAYILHDVLYHYDCREGSLTQMYKPLMYERKCRLFSYYESILSKERILEDETGKKRYAQFVIEHLYDCMVMEIQWNKNIRERNQNIKKILSDKKLKESRSVFNCKELSLKARLMLQVMSLKNPTILSLLYNVCHGVAGFRRRGKR